MVFKPHGLPTAPLREDETHTLLGWYLVRFPEAAAVAGKKNIEHGLIHRLDTPTEGLVLIAKNQAAYDKFQEAQSGDLIRKTYQALCDLEGGNDAWKLVGGLPHTIQSRFRAWGPGGREVRPVFEGDRRYESAGRDYTTILEALDLSLPGKALCRCSLTRGYRHQVRAHLASLHIPIEGDSLYNRLNASAEPENAAAPVLALSAVSITFPDPDSSASITISLP